MNAFQARRRFRELRHTIKAARRDMVQALQQLKEARATVAPDGLAQWTGGDGARVEGRYAHLREIVLSDIADDVAEIRDASAERARLVAVFGTYAAFSGESVSHPFKA